MTIKDKIMLFLEELTPSELERRWILILGKDESCELLDLFTGSLTWNVKRQTIKGFQKGEILESIYVCGVTFIIYLVSLKNHFIIADPQYIFNDGKIVRV